METEPQCLGAVEISGRIGGRRLHCEAQALTCSGAAVCSSGSALRGCVRPELLEWTGGALLRGLCTWFLAAEPCGAPAQVSPIPLEEPAHQNPVLWEGV